MRKRYFSNGVHMLQLCESGDIFYVFKTKYPTSIINYNCWDLITRYDNEKDAIAKITSLTNLSKSELLPTIELNDERAYQIINNYINNNNK